MTSISKIRFEDGANKGEIVVCLCGSCNRSTRHEIKCSYDQIGNEYDRIAGWSVDWSNRYQIIQCQGCETISFRHTNWCSEVVDFDYDGTSEELYPKRTKNELPRRDFHQVPHKILSLYREAISCFNFGGALLCAAGLRSIVEAICADQNVEDGPVMVGEGDASELKRRRTLEGKIAGLHERRILDEQSMKTLHEHRYLGNSALHELSRPTEEMLRLAIEIIEHMLHHLYEIPAKGRLLEGYRSGRSQ